MPSDADEYINIPIIEIHPFSNNNTDTDSILQSQKERNHRQTVRITIRGPLHLCTSDEVENARLRKLRAFHRRRCSRGVLPSEEVGDRDKDEGGGSATGYKAEDLSFVERYVVLEKDYQRRCNSARKKHRLRVDRVVVDTPSPSSTIPNKGDDGHGAQSTESSSINGTNTNEDGNNNINNSYQQPNETTTIFNAHMNDDGGRVLATWYFRASSLKVKDAWLQIMTRLEVM
ncbi:predicted protein [Thalassiosira pseudonana CCMP1335]|uniref:Uncharacterized protein n=1 Tax=Thalassiosira pseudonana TaxID=35128 RepID=B8C4Q3_THAPS|nr:predicted protein [Thalassiosira pseudonana CCMP1335]EED91364.1 predicted protein [Thalassiosira pseudonana CCMP1335]